MDSLAPEAQIVKLIIEFIFGRAAFFAQKIKRIDSHAIVYNFNFGLAIFVEHDSDESCLGIDRVVNKFFYAIW